MRVALVFCMVLLTAELAAQFDMNTLKAVIHQQLLFWLYAYYFR